MKRKKFRDRKTRLYYLMIIAKIVADITIIIGFGIVAYLLARAYIFNG